MFQKPCSICSAPQQAREAIEQALADRVPMVKIASETGYSKSAIGRHSQKCLQANRLKRVRGLKFNPETDRVVFKDAQGRYLDPDYSPPTTSAPMRYITEADLRPTDWVLETVYADFGVFNPSALDATMKVSGQKTQSGAVGANESTTPPSPPVTEEQIAEPPQEPHIPPSPEPPSTANCNHRMFRVSGDVWRCQDCGYQPPPSGPSRVTPVPLDQLNNRRRRF